jgi:hypothetical protein
MNMFAPRYVISLVIGFAILFAYGAFEASRGGKLAGAGLAVILAGWFVYWNTPLPQSIRNPPIQFSRLTLPKDTRIDGLRLLIATPHDAVACFYSCPEEVRSRAAYAADPDLALRYAGFDIADESILGAGKLYSLPVMRWRNFSKENRQFLLLWQKDQFEWILEHLQAVSARVEVLSSAGTALVLFVTLPE